MPSVVGQMARYGVVSVLRLFNECCCSRVGFGQEGVIAARGVDRLIYPRLVVAAGDPAALGGDFDWLARPRAGGHL